jgi:PiT family inorganic phosphate transporter
MIVVFLLTLMVIFVAYSNGANDNFKGVATLYGANVADYKMAISVASVATFAGCVASVFFAESLVQAFSGKGLVPDAVAATPNFVLSVATGAGVTVILATLFGFPISTTHSLTGALVGAGYMAVGNQLNFSTLGSAFFLPLLVSPLMSTLISMPTYKFAHFAVQRLGITKHSCVCIAPGQFVPAAQFHTIDGLDGCCGDACAPAVASAMPTIPEPCIRTGSAPDCTDKYSGHVIGITAQSLVDSVHYISAAAVSFARGLNDTPKIVGLLLVVQAFNLKVSLLAIAIAMAIGGWLNAHKVAVTMSKRISKMNDGQALVANLVTAFMVIFASRLGMPVSTTHVAVGSISGIGIINGTANGGVISGIAMSWVSTLPVAAIVSAIVYLGLQIVL